MLEHLKNTYRRLPLSVRNPLRSVRKGVKSILLRASNNQLAHCHRQRRYYPILKIAVTGSKGKTTTSLLCAHILNSSYDKVGCATTDGLYINKEMCCEGSHAGNRGPRELLRRHGVDAVVLETAREGIIKEGLFLGSVDGAALLNIGVDHVGMDGVRTQIDMALIKKRVTDTSSGVVVLNAGDPIVRALLPEYMERSLVLYSLNRHDVQNHVAAGGRAVTLDEDKHIVVVSGNNPGELQRIVHVSELSFCRDGLEFNVQNSLAAVALTYPFIGDAAILSERLRTFVPNMVGGSDRFYVAQETPFLVVSDRTCSATGLQGLLPAFESMASSGGMRRCVLTAAGNRPDWIFEEMARLLVAAGFLEIFIYEHRSSLNGRSPNEVVRLLRDSFLKLGMPPDSVSIMRGFGSCVERVVGISEAGDTVLILGVSDWEKRSVVRRCIRRIGLDVSWP